MPGTLKVEGTVKDAPTGSNVENPQTQLDPTENVSYVEKSNDTYSIPGGGGSVVVPLVSMLTPTNTIKEIILKTDTFILLDFNALGDLPCRKNFRISADPVNYPANAITSLTITNNTAGTATVEIFVAG